MKSIEATLNLVSNIVSRVRKRYDIEIALAGGYAVIAHGVGRTTTDVDFYLYSERIQENPTEFFELLKQEIPNHFNIKVVEGSKMLGDPFPYDILFLTDKSDEYPRIDFIIPRYKWELEGIRVSKSLEDIPFPVLPKPYLIAMKLRAGGPKDSFDVIELYSSLSEEEKIKTTQLAVLIKRDKNLAKLLETKEDKIEEPEDKELLIFG
ncbi:MAG: nucleotidyl transferase AbiEii/AbiGii toxin family protein [bacterium]|nr:nucleotidyl transferase AbiEii/AbiGii toxin family protein [bacterium]